ncbi:hypothetical protein HanRHA438_Chr04g0174171 [Helianthus annuus]|nr:hypothetical protein HanRHA438_Chr04g0174171 [Helianthus annuus]
MKAEYFPLKEIVILQNEAPTDFYILVSKLVVSLDFLNFIYVGLKVMYFLNGVLMVNYLSIHQQIPQNCVF